MRALDFLQLLKFDEINIPPNFKSFTLNAIFGYVDNIYVNIYIYYDADMSVLINSCNVLLTPSDVLCV